MEKSDLTILPELSVFFDSFQSRSGEGRTAILPCLFTAQDLYGYIPDFVITEISADLNISLEDVNNVVDFYPLFHREPINRTIMHVCNDPHCKMAGADSVHKLIRFGFGEKTDKPDSTGSEIEKAPCLGLCAHTPSLQIQGGLLRIPVKESGNREAGEINRYTHTTIMGEKRLITSNCGTGKTCTLMEYWNKAGYQALKSVLTMPPETIIGEIKTSSLVGRGGESFLTGLKWEKVIESRRKPHYIVCNGCETDPQTYKDRVLMEDDPHRILEGMIIGGYAIQANQGFIVVNGEYDLAYQSLSQALIDAREAGFLGNHIMGSNFSFDIELRKQGGRYCSGEETALLESLEGKCAIPRGKPPFPTSKGLFGKPTVINNVETLCNIPVILRMGAMEYRKIGTDTSKGTVLLCLTGDIKKSGLLEVPYGTTFRQIIHEYGNGPESPDGFHTALIGGVAGTFIQETDLDLDISFDMTPKGRLSLGSGSIVVLGKNRDIRNIVKHIARYFMLETCGKCSACVEGVHLQSSILEKNGNHQVTSSEFRKYKDICLDMEQTSFCKMGRFATNACRSAMEIWPSLLSEV